MLNTAELMHLNPHDAFENTFARVYMDWQWQDLPGEIPPDSFAAVPFAGCNQVVKEEFRNWHSSNITARTYWIRWGLFFSLIGVLVALAGALLWQRLR